MLIVFDVGNTETTLGVFDGPTMVANWRVTTDVSRTADECGLLLRGLLQSAGIAEGAIQSAAIGSVVPPMTAPLARACERYLGAAPILVDARSALPIRLDVDEPQTVGADRVINTLAVQRLYGVDCICVDLGTATTFDCILADGTFIGGVIMPGVRSSADSLVRRTSKLSATELIAPPHVIGRRTEDCIRSGVLFGAADAINGMVHRIRAEWPRPGTPHVVATGGLAETLAPWCPVFDRVVPHLTLEGLRMAHEHLTESAVKALPVRDLA